MIDWFFFFSFLNLKVSNFKILPAKSRKSYVFASNLLRFSLCFWMLIWMDLPCVFGCPFEWILLWMNFPCVFGCWFELVQLWMDFPCVSVGGGGIRVSPDQKCQHFWSGLTLVPPPLSETQGNSIQSWTNSNQHPKTQRKS